MLFLLFIASAFATKFYKAKGAVETLFVLEDVKKDLSFKTKIYNFADRQMSFRAEGSSLYVDLKSINNVKESFRLETVEAEYSCDVDVISKKHHYAVTLEKDGVQIKIYPTGSCVNGMKIFNAQTSVQVFEYKDNDKKWSTACNAAGTKEYLVKIYKSSSKSFDDSVKNITTEICFSPVAEYKRYHVLGSELMYHEITEPEWEFAEIVYGKYVISQHLSTDKIQSSTVWFCEVTYCTQINLPIRKLNSDSVKETHLQKAYLCAPNSLYCSNGLPFRLSFSHNSKNATINIQNSLFVVDQENYGEYKGKPCKIISGEFDGKKIVKDEFGNKFYIDINAPAYNEPTIKVKPSTESLLIEYPYNKCTKVDDIYISYRYALLLDSREMKQKPVEIYFKDSDCKIPTKLFFLSLYNERNEKTIKSDISFRIVSHPSEGDCKKDRGLGSSPFETLNCPMKI